MSCLPVTKATRPVYGLLLPQPRSCLGTQVLGVSVVLSTDHLELTNEECWWKSCLVIPRCLVTLPDPSGSPHISWGKKLPWLSWTSLLGTWWELLLFWTAYVWVLPGICQALVNIVSHSSLVSREWKSLKYANEPRTELLLIMLDFLFPFCGPALSRSPWMYRFTCFKA